MKTIATLVLLTVYVTVCAQREVVINNLKPRMDTDGNIVDAHDGQITRFGNKFYWYGTAYGNTTGYVRTNYFQCYSSSDLMNWKKEGYLLKNEPYGIYYRPHVIYNSKTRKYVLWYNWYEKFWDGKYGVAVSDKPTGPFKIVNTDVKMFYSKEGVGDYGLFIDADNTAYIAYNTINGHKGSIEKLKADYFSSTMENGGFITEDCEAGAIFKRNNKYYMLTDYTCCFCTQGSGVRVYTSDYPTKGYQLRNNINRYPGIPSPELIDEIKTPNIYTTLFRQKDSLFNSAQVNFSKPTPVNTIKIYQFTGNRNGVCGDTLATKVHDEIAIPEFELSLKQDGGWVKVIPRINIEMTSVNNIIILTFEASASESVSLRPAKTYRYNSLFINKIEAYNGLQPIKSIQAFVISDNPGLGSPVIPAQQTFVMPLETTNGIRYIWMGDLWGSASDNVKGHDYQYWGEPLIFDENGDIKMMRWVDEWRITIR